MKPIYKSLVLTNMALAVTLSLQANVTSDGASTPQAVNAETLEGLKVELVVQNVSGARDLIASGECVIDGANLAITLNATNWIKGATYRVQVLATFGTNTVVLYALNVTVPRYATIASGTQEYADNVTVVSTFGDGDTSGADASVYAKDGDGNAHITKPLSIEDGVATGTGAIASGNADGGASIQATGDGAIASGNAYGEGASIQATGDGTIASGCAYGEGASIQAKGTGAIANGYADGGASIQAKGTGAIANGYADGGASIQANSNGAIAIGYADGGASIQATSDGAIASGNADGGASIQATSVGAIAIGYADGGASIQATSVGAIASGNADGAGATIQANSNGAIASGNADGEGASIQATGDGAIASGHAGKGASIQATGAGAIASGYADETNGHVKASGIASQALGIGVEATQDGQMVVGKCNVVDEDNTFAFIVGNGADNEHRHNAFGVTKSGSLALFKADGTPIYLDAAKLEALIALLQNA